MAGIWQASGKPGVPPCGSIFPDHRKEVSLTTSTWNRRAGTVLAAAAAGVLLVSGTAYASDTSVSVADGSGWASWTENGDSLRVCDTEPDGWGVRGYIYRPNSGDPANGTVLMKASDPKYDDDCVAVSVNVDETIRLSIKVCNYKDSSVTLCGYRAIPGRPIIET